MNFLYPAFLFGLAAISIPVVIHLFHFRKFKKVFFSNTAFLQAIKTEKQNKNRLRNLLVLLLRILAISMLVFAFAQPYFPSKVSTQSGSEDHVCIYLDNSPSMAGIAGKSDLLSTAKALAEEIIRSYPDNTRIYLMTNDPYLLSPVFSDKNKVLKKISDLSFSSYEVQQADIASKINNLLKEQTGPGRFAYFISDFQESTLGIDNWVTDSLIHCFAVSVQPDFTDNISIDSAWFENPYLKLNDEARISIQITNRSDRQLAQLPVRIMVNGKQKGISNISLKEQQTGRFEIPFSVSDHGWNKLEVSIEDFPFNFDDVYYLSYYIDKFSPVLEIKAPQTKQFISTAFNTDKYFKFNSMPETQIEYAGFSANRLIILNQLTAYPSGLLSALKDFVLPGGNLLLIPSTDSTRSLGEYSRFFDYFNLPGFTGTNHVQEKIKNLATGNVFFSGVFDDIPRNMDLPIVTKYYKRSLGNTEIALMNINSQDALISESAYGRGHIYILSAPLNDNWTQFQNHALFVPVMYKMVLSSFNSFQNSYFLGQSDIIDVPVTQLPEVALFSLRSKDVEFIPRQRVVPGHIYIFPDNNFSHEGFYEISNEGVKEAPVVAMNINRKESNTELLSDDELKVFFKENKIYQLSAKPGKMKADLAVAQNGKPLWFWFVAGALLFLLVEILVLRTRKI